MKILRRSCGGSARRPALLWLAGTALLWLAGTALLTLSGCGQTQQAPASVEQMRRDAAGGPIPADALQKYMASHPSAAPPPGGPAQKPPGQKP